MDNKPQSKPTSAPAVTPLDLLIQLSKLQAETNKQLRSLNSKISFFVGLVILAIVAQACSILSSFGR